MKHENLVREGCIQGGTRLRAIAAGLNCSGIYTVRGGLGSVSGADRAAGAGSALTATF